MEIPVLLTILGGAVLRNVQGWLPTALKDGIDSYEWKQLAVTTVRVVFVAGSLHFGLDVAEEAATAVAMLADFAIGEIGKLIAAAKAKKAKK